MAQYDVYRNLSATTSTEFPFLLEVQSNLFEDSTRAVIVPMIMARSLSQADKLLNPEFEVDGNTVCLFPLDIASASRAALLNKVCNLNESGDSIVAALDLLLARC